MQGIGFVKSDMVTMRIVVISVASFAKVPGLKSRLAYTILMADKERCANNINYSSCRCHRVSRMVMAAEVHALIHAVEIGMLMKEILGELMNWEIKMEAYVESRTLFKVIAKNSSTAEHCLQIDVFSLKENY